MTEQSPDQGNKPGAGGSSAGGAQAGERGDKVAGACIPRKRDRARMVLKGINEKVVHLKAVRRLSAYLEANSTIGSIGAKEIDALGVVATWLLINEKEAGPRDVIVGWSGYTRNWEYKIHSGIRECEARDMIETLRVAGGTRIAITLKGQRVIALYEQMLEVVRNEFEESREKARAKIQAKAMQEIGITE